MASRILAIVAAVGMIAGAYVYRYGMPGDGGDGGSGGGGGAGAAGAVICASDLGAVCTELAGATVQPAAETARRLIEASSAAYAGVGAWVVADPWPAMVDEARSLDSRAPLFEERPEALASTTLAAVARAGQFPVDCPRPVTWRCLGDAAQDPTFRIGAEPASSSPGLFARAAALGAFFGTVDYATNDLDERPEARSWLDNLDRRLAAAPGFGARSLESFVLQRGSASVYLTTTAAAQTLLANPDFEVVAPVEPVVVRAVVARAGDDGPRLDTGAVRDAFTVAGWERATRNQASTGLPSPGVLLALSEV